MSFFIFLVQNLSMIFNPELIHVQNYCQEDFLFPLGVMPTNRVCFTCTSALMHDMGLNCPAEFKLVSHANAPVQVLEFKARACAYTSL